MYVFLLERKKTGKVEETISRRILILSCTLQTVITNVCSNFQSPRSNSS